MTEVDDQARSKRLAIVSNWVKQLFRACDERDFDTVHQLLVKDPKVSRPELSLIMAIYTSRISRRLYPDGSDKTEVDAYLLENHLRDVSFGHPTLSDSWMANLFLRALYDQDNWMTILAEGATSFDEWWERQWFLLFIAIRANGGVDVQVIDEVLSFVSSGSGSLLKGKKGMELVTSSAERDVIEQLLPTELTKTDLVAYMRYCPVVLSARTRVPDKVNPNSPMVPLAYFSDGQFVWSAETVAYVDRYGAGLPDQFLRHVATYVSQHGDAPPDVPIELLREATEMLKGDDRE